jgi:hypothetical protein
MLFAAWFPFARESKFCEPNAHSDPDRIGPRSTPRQYGSQLVRVRLHYDAERCPRFRAVELIVEQAPIAVPARIIDADAGGLPTGAIEAKL